MVEEDFESKKHVTRHITLGRFGRTEEATRVNSAEEQHFLHWKLFLARNLEPENVTPDVLKTICDASEIYRKTYKSYPFGVRRSIQGKGIYVIVAATVIGVMLLYFMGVF